MLMQIVKTLPFAVDQSQYGLLLFISSYLLFLQACVMGDVWYDHYVV